MKKYSIKYQDGNDLKELILVYYTHLRAHETKAKVVCRLLLEKKKEHISKNN